MEGQELVQMKPARTAGSALSLLREFFPSSVGLLQRNQVGAIYDLIIHADRFATAKSACHSLKVNQL